MKENPYCLLQSSVLSHLHLLFSVNVLAKQVLRVFHSFPPAHTSLYYFLCPYDRFCSDVLLFKGLITH